MVESETDHIMITFHCTTKMLKQFMHETNFHLIHFLNEFSAQLHFSIIALLPRKFIHYHLYAN